MENTHRATYSPDDNKLRMYPAFWLEKEVYNRFNTLGFRWAPKQKIFVAPMWTPDREDILIEMCGDIQDDDTSLIERSEERAERFSQYSEKRLEDAHQAKQAVFEITDHIPLGQPILVGHHSEKKARKDAEKIERGMKKAVNMWETSKYWTNRAAGALAHAKYKENPSVRARRIKKIEAEVRKYLASYTPKNPDDIFLQTRHTCPICNKYSCDIHVEAKQKIEYVYCGQGRGGSWVPVENLPKIEKYYSRWISHCEKRLLYEKAMLGEQGSLDLLANKPKPKQLPLLNYLAPEGLSVENMYHKGEFSVYPQVEMTKAEYKKIYVDYRGTVKIENSHRVRLVCNFKGSFDRNLVFLTDSKVHKKPLPVKKDEPKPSPQTLKPSTFIKAERSVFHDLKDSLNSGIKVVSSDQLFPTPQDLAQKMVEEANIQPGQCVLDPEGGTGNLIEAVLSRFDTEVLTYEINKDLCTIMENKFPPYKVQVRHRDFLTVTDFQGCYPRIIMNPPFKNGEDIKHIKHALTFLSKGGRLVSLCANGPRQKEQLMPIVEESGGSWEDLPAGTFKNQGTMVNTALIVIEG